MDSYNTGNEVYPSFFHWYKLEKAWFNIVSFSPPGNFIPKRSNLGQPPTGVPINRICPLYLLSLCKVSGFNLKASKNSMTSIYRKLWSVNVLYFFFSLVTFSLFFYTTYLSTAEFKMSRFCHVQYILMAPFCIFQWTLNLD